MHNASIHKGVHVSNETGYKNCARGCVLAHFCTRQMINNQIFYYFQQQVI